MWFKKDRFFNGLVINLLQFIILTRFLKKFLAVRKISNVLKNRANFDWLTRSKRTKKKNPNHQWNSNITLILANTVKTLQTCRLACSSTRNCTAAYFGNKSWALWRKPIQTSTKRTIMRRKDSNALASLELTTRDKTNFTSWTRTLTPKTSRSRTSVPWISNSRRRWGRSQRREFCFFQSQPGMACARMDISGCF